MTYAASPIVVLTAEMDGWKRQGSDDEAWQPMVGVLLYPRRSGGWFIRGSAGYSFFKGRIFDGPRETGGGPGFLVGVGHDLRVASMFSITPVVSALFANQGTTTELGLPARTGVSEWAIGVTVNATWH